MLAILCCLDLLVFFLIKLHRQVSISVWLARVQWTNMQYALTSKRFSLWLKSSKKSTKSLSWHKEKKLRVVIWHLFGDLSQSETLSEIKPPLLGKVYQNYILVHMKETSNSLTAGMIWAVIVQCINSGIVLTSKEIQIIPRLFLVIAM